MVQTIIVNAGFLLATVVVLFLAARLALSVGIVTPVEPPAHENPKVKWAARVIAVIFLLGAAALALKGIKYMSTIEGGLHYTYSIVLGFILAMTFSQFKGHRSRYPVTGVLLLAVVAWYMWPNWLTGDILALCLTVLAALLAQLQTPFLWTALTMIGIICAYDMFQVYVSTDMENAGRAAMTEFLPVIVTVPDGFHLAAQPVGGLGVGDLVLSVILIIMAGRLSLRTGVPQFFRNAMIGYAIGFTIAFVVVNLAQVAQPATIFLLPAITIGVLVAARRHRQMPALRRRLNAEAWA